jgi:hypothetical protein
MNRDVLPDHRFYSRYFGLTKESAYQPVSQPVSPSAVK